MEGDTLVVGSQGLPPGNFELHTLRFLHSDGFFHPFAFFLHQLLVDFSWMGNSKSQTPKVTVQVCFFFLFNMIHVASTHTLRSWSHVMANHVTLTCMSFWTCDNYGMHWSEVHTREKRNESRWKQEKIHVCEWEGDTWKYEYARSRASEGGRI